LVVDLQQGRERCGEAESGDAPRSRQRRCRCSAISVGATLLRDLDTGPLHPRPRGAAGSVGVVAEAAEQQPWLWRRREAEQPTGEAPRGRRKLRTSGGRAAVLGVVVARSEPRDRCPGAATEGRGWQWRKRMALTSSTKPTPVADSRCGANGGGDSSRCG
jgi:hypothetical protein